MENSVKEFRNSLVETLNKNQEDFEKQLIYVSAGALGASIFFIEKIVRDLDSSLYKWLLICSWLFLGATIVINAISHFVAINMNYKSIDEIDQGNYEAKAALKRNRKLKYINLSTVITLLIGIFFLILFASINLIMSDKNNNADNSKVSQGTTLVTPHIEEKLARIANPPPPNPKPPATADGGKKQ
jgi:magnesium-transporting ATPase (P-type)